MSLRQASVDPPKSFRRAQSTAAVTVVHVLHHHALVDPACSGGPFRSASWPVIAEASLALPPGPTSAAYTTLSAAAAGRSHCRSGLSAMERMPAWSAVLVPVTYVWSVCALTLATGLASSGVGIVILIPLFWTVLFQRRCDSFIVLANIVAVEIVTSLTPVHVADAVLARRIVFWTMIGLLIVDEHTWLAGPLASHPVRARGYVAPDQCPRRGGDGIDRDVRRRRRPLYRLEDRGGTGVPVAIPRVAARSTPG